MRKLLTLVAAATVFILVGLFTFHIIPRRFNDYSEGFPRESLLSDPNRLRVVTSTFSNLDSFPMCQHPIWGQPCLVWKQHMMQGQREYRAKQEKIRNSSQSNALCPQTPDEQVVVQIRSECMWGDQLRTFLDVKSCPVPCRGIYEPNAIRKEANIVVDHCDFKEKPQFPVLHAALTLEYNGPAVEWNRPILTARDFVKQWQDKYYGGTLSVQHMESFDLQVHWVREFADVFVNYMYAWVDACGNPQHYATSRCKLDAPSVEELDQRGFAVAFISHCVPQRTRYLRELNANLLELSAGLKQITHFGACEHTSGAEANRGAQAKAQHLAKYKFTISFENSLRPDYFSEKHIEAVLANTLPVIWAAPGVEDFLPGGKGSFVSALDFATPRDLAVHLLALDTNTTWYLEHFAWRNKNELNPTFVEQTKYNLLGRGENSFVCRLCEVYKTRYCFYSF